MIVGDENNDPAIADPAIDGQTISSGIDKDNKITNDNKKNIEKNDLIEIFDNIDNNNDNDSIETIDNSDYGDKENNAKSDRCDDNGIINSNDNSDKRNNNDDNDVYKDSPDDEACTNNDFGVNLEFMSANLVEEEKNEGQSSSCNTDEETIFSSSSTLPQHQARRDHFQATDSIEVTNHLDRVHQANDTNEQRSTILSLSSSSSIVSIDANDFYSQASTAPRGSKPLDSIIVAGDDNYGCTSHVTEITAAYQSSDSAKDAILADINDAIELADQTIRNLHQYKYTNLTSTDSKHTFEQLLNYEHMESPCTYETNSVCSTSGYSNLSNSVRNIKTNMFDQVDKIMQEIHDIDRINEYSTTKSVDTDEGQQTYHHPLFYPKEYLMSWMMHVVDEVTTRSDRSSCSSSRSTSSTNEHDDARTLSSHVGVDDVTAQARNCHKTSLTKSGNQHQTGSERIDTEEAIDFVVQDMFMIDQDVPINLLQLNIDLIRQEMKEAPVAHNDMVHFRQETHEDYNDGHSSKKRKNNTSYFKKKMSRWYSRCCRPVLPVFRNNRKSHRSKWIWVFLFVVIIIVGSTTLALTSSKRCNHNESPTNNVSIAVNNSTYGSDNSTTHSNDNEGNNINNSVASNWSSSSSATPKPTPIFVHDVSTQNSVPTIQPTRNSQPTIDDDIFMNPTNATTIPPPDNLKPFELAIWYIVLDALVNPSYLLNVKSKHYEAFEFLIQDGSITSRYETAIQDIIEKQRTNPDDGHTFITDVVQGNPYRTQIVQRYILKLIDLIMNPITKSSSKTSRISITSSSSDECDWYGISCIPPKDKIRKEEFDSGKVVYKIDWSNIGLHGTIPAEIGALSDQLSYLDLSQNKLYGTIPYTMYDNYRLNSLFLQSNNLSGTISPKIELLGELRSLDLSNNQLSGSIPASLRIDELLATEQFGTIITH
jgi:hypothetical protein